MSWYKTKSTPMQRCSHLIIHSSTEFLCDGCKTNGTGPKYRCHPCDFDLHEFCATSTRTLSTFMHPHPLSIAVRSTQPVNKRTCNVCADDIKGLFYRCKGCGFDVHPLCTQFPQKVTHNYHKEHTLTLQAAPAGWYCGVCAGPCGATLRYRCGPCNFDIHAQCIVIQFVPPNQTPPKFVPPPHGSTPAAPPPYGAFPYGAAGSSSSSPYNPYQFGNQDPNNMYNYMNRNPNNVYNYYMNQAQSGATEAGNGKSMYAILGKLALGALSNMTFGSDFTSFM